MFVPLRPDEVIVYRSEVLPSGVVVQVTNAKYNPTHYELRFQGAGKMPSKYRGTYTNLRAALFALDMYLLEYKLENSRSVIEVEDEETGKKILVKRPFAYSKNKKLKLATDKVTEEDEEECQEDQQ